MSYSGSACSGDETHSVGGSSTDEAGRRCAIGFNPSNHAPTEKIKSFCACAMKSVIDERDRVAGEFSNRKTELEGGRASRCLRTRSTATMTPCDASRLRLRSSSTRR